MIQGSPKTPPFMDNPTKRCGVTGGVPGMIAGCAK